MNIKSVDNPKSDPNLYWSKAQDPDELADDVYRKWWWNGEKYTEAKCVAMTAHDILQTAFLEKDINDMEGIIMDIESLNDEINAWNKEEIYKQNEKMKRLKELSAKEQNGSISEDEKKEAEQLRASLNVNESEGKINELGENIKQKQQSVNTEIDKTAISSKYVATTRRVAKELADINKNNKTVETTNNAADNLDSTIQNYKAHRKSIFSMK